MNTDVKFSTLIHEISLLVSRLFNRRVKDLRMTRSQWMVLYRLHSDGVQSQTELATNLSIAKQPLGKIIDKLENDGWVTRMLNPNDKREKLVSMTDKVTPIIGPLSGIVEEIDSLALVNMTSKDRYELLEVLSLARKHLKAGLE